MHPVTKMAIGKFFHKVYWEISDFIIRHLPIIFVLALVGILLPSCLHAQEPTNPDGYVKIKCKGGTARCLCSKQLKVYVDLQLGTISVYCKNEILVQSGVDEITVEDGSGFRTLIWGW